MRIHTMIQYSPEWWGARAGHVTASNGDRIITPLGKPSGGAERYVAEIVAEERDGVRPNFFTDRPMSPAMRHGLECEPEARRWYEFHCGVNVRMVGGVESDCGRLWSSPDGLIGEVGVLELKCPQPATQEGYLRDGVLPRAYRPQVHFHLLITRREFVEFVSYVPGMDQLVVRVEPDEFTFACAEALAAFLGKLEAARRAAGLRPWPGTPGAFVAQTERTVV